MKLAPVHGALAASPGVDQILVHTGQHYDVSMSDIFFQQLEKGHGVHRLRIPIR
jgi:UDP-N-acetylglucosamine 2-epimerase (non-hydrolysing)